MRSPAPGGSATRIGLALAGGGPQGAIYEIGALRALDEALDGIDLSALHTYVGVSAGSFLAGCLANGMTTAQLCRAIVKREPGQHPLRPATFYTPAFREFLHRSLTLPRLAAETLSCYVAHPRDQSLLDPLLRLSRALPVGLFDNEPVRAYLQRIFEIRGRTDDFRKLRTQLFVVAADLDSGEAVRFGEPGLDHVPISTAIQASSALPGLYPPVAIDGRHYVDGVLLKTLHASVALDAGVDLLICINPIVPVNTRPRVVSVTERGGRLVSRGLPTVLSQTFRTLVHSRLAVGLSTYAPRYPERDLVLIEPSRDDYRMFFTNIFSFSQRKAVCQHAYRSTRRFLSVNRGRLEPILARHGVRYRDEILTDEEREVWQGLDGTNETAGAAVARRLDRALSRLESLLADRPRREPLAVTRVPRAGSGRRRGETVRPTRARAR